MIELLMLRFAAITVLVRTALCIEVYQILILSILCQFSITYLRFKNV